MSARCQNQTSHPAEILKRTRIRGTAVESFQIANERTWMKALINSNSDS
jgi:hypothetical protein